MLAAFGIEESRMPRIVHPWDLAGGLTKETAQACGLIEGTPVVCGCGDTAACAVGAGVIRPGVLFDVAGTASVFACAVGEYQPDTKYKTILFAPGVIEGLGYPCESCFNGKVRHEFMLIDFEPVTVQCELMPSKEAIEQEGVRPIGNIL